MMTESRGPGSNPFSGGAVGEDVPGCATKSTPWPLSGSSPGKPVALPPRRSKEETSGSDSGSAPERSARGREKRKRVAQPRDSVGSGSDSSGSPLRRPKSPLVPVCTEEDGTVIYGYTDDQAVMDKYHDDVQKYNKKCARHQRLLTLAPSSVTERRTFKETEAVLKCAQSVLSLSAYLDDKLVNQCTGIVVGADASKNSAIVVTSALIFCNKKPLDDWRNKDYAAEAKVNVHMLDDSTLECRLMFFSKHYEIAFFEIRAIQLQTLTLESNVEFGQDVFLLARETNLNLIYKRDKVQLVDPCEHQHNHYMFVNGPIPQCGSGGGVLDVSGNIVGMLFYKLPLVAFIPSSLILKCLTMWQHFRQLAQPQLGLKLRTLAFLDIPRIELMSRKFSISSGLIVKEISANCDAEKLGIRAGDVIFSCQNKRVLSIVQLEHVLLGVGEKHLEKGNAVSSKVDVEIGVFHVRKHTKSVITLRVELSDHLEVFHSDEDTKAEGSTGEEAQTEAVGEAKP